MQLLGKHVKAATLLAEDSLSDERIAEECEITRRTLANWKLDADFAAVVREKVQELDDQVSKLRFAKRRERIRALNEQAEDYLTIVAERGKWFADEDPDIPGGKTGRLVKMEKVIGTGQNAVRTTEYVADVALERQFAATMKQIAQERGEWAEKRELSGPNGTPLLPIVEIEVFKQVSPPDDDDD